MQAMDPRRIAELLIPFLGSETLTDIQIGQTAAYLNLLLKWNARMNLTAVRAPEEMVVRHFGESFFAARHVCPDPADESTVVDVGSGAGFPGLPVSILRPRLKVTLIEAHGKKATFLKEAIRTLGTNSVKVFAGRAEQMTPGASVVTLRAVEKFERVVVAAERIVAEKGRLALLIGEAQADRAKELLESRFGHWTMAAIPGSQARVIQVFSR